MKRSRTVRSTLDSINDLTELEDNNTNNNSNIVSLSSSPMFHMGLASSNSGGMSGRSNRAGSNSGIWYSSTTSLSPLPRSRTTSATPESDIAFMNDIFHYLGGLNSGEGDRSGYSHSYSPKMTRCQSSKRILTIDEIDRDTDITEVQHPDPSNLTEASNSYFFYDVGLPLDEEDQDTSGSAPLEVSLICIRLMS